MKIPESIRINGVEYSIGIVDDLRSPHSLWPHKL